MTQKLLDRLRHPVEPDPVAGSLTAREREILDLIAEGCTNRQIGERLFLAEKTVKNYVSGLLTKLGMQRRTQAAVYGATLRRRTGGDTWLLRMDSGRRTAVLGTRSLSTPEEARKIRYQQCESGHD